MSSEKKLSNGTRCHDSNIWEGPHHNGSRNCEVDKSRAILKNVPKSNYYESIFEYCSKVADELPQRQAFYVVDLEDILWKVQEWVKVLPNVEIFYAVKANTDPVLLQLLVKLGLSFDCASWGEITKVLNAGASPQNIIFAHTIKTVEELKLASEKGVELMTFDNEDELLKIHTVYPKAKLLIRIIPEVLSCFYDLSKTFGCSEDNALKLLRLAQQLNLNVIGISFHVGTLCTDPVSYTSTIETSRRIFDAAKDLGFTFSILDIGGGFFGSSGTQDIFYKMAYNINNALEEHFPCNQVRLIAEPGFYIVNSAFNIVCTVIGKRCIDNVAEGKPKRYYYLNDGIFCSFSNDIQIYGVQKPTPILPDTELESRPEYESLLHGQTCSPRDIIKDNVVIQDLKIGERIIWCNMGGYSHSLSSTFCVMPIPIAKYIFVHKQRLNTDWIAAKENIIDFLIKHVCFIRCSEDVI